MARKVHFLVYNLLSKFYPNRYRPTVSFSVFWVSSGDIDPKHLKKNLNFVYGIFLGQPSTYYMEKIQNSKGHR